MIEFRQSKGTKIVAFLVWAIAALSANAQDREDIIILVPPLTGTDQIAATTTNLMQLQVSATFQEANTDTRGRMIFGRNEIATSTHQEAVSRGLELTALADLVLWGNAYSLADGVAVETFLSVTPLAEQSASFDNLSRSSWVVPVPSSQGETRKLVLSLPRKFYRLPAVLVDLEAATEYQSLQGMTIYGSREFKTPIGETGPIFRAFTYTKDGVRLRSNGVEGWVRLAFVVDSQNAVVEFTGAVFRILRGDYQGALQLLEGFSEYQELPTGLRVDAALLTGLAKELQGRSGMRHFQFARDLAPFDHVAARYLLLAKTEEAIARTGTERQESLKELAALLAETQLLFSQSSRWFSSIKNYSDNSKN